MDLVLVGMTVISLALAIGMSVLVFRLQRDERLRSEARMAILVAAAGEEPLDLYEPEPMPVLAPEGQASAAADLFATSDVESLWPRRLAIAATVAIGVAGLGYGLASFRAPAPAREAAVTVPLELIALGHRLEDGAMTINGTVLNPQDGASVTRIGVTATVLDQEGRTLASGRAPLDYATLAPGDESPFEIRLPLRGTVNRYRVGFRRADGSVIAHLDRRVGIPSAQNTNRTESAPWVR